MTKEEAIKELEEYIEDTDRCISEDPEYIRGWKSAMLVAIETVGKIKEARALENENYTKEDYENWEGGYE